MQDFDDLASNTSSRHSRANALGAGAANSSKQLVFPEPTTTKLLTKYFPLFPILLTFKRANLRIVSTIGLVLFAMQHWAFVLNPHMKDHLGYQLGNVIAYIVYGSQLSFYDPVMVASASVTAFLVVVYLLLAVTLVLVGCILFHLRPMDDHSEGKGITSDAARLLLNVMSTALLIPILQFCFASCVCGSSGYMWMLPNVENAVCWGSSHIAAFIPSLICLIVLIPLLYLKNTCVYDYAILSDTFQSRRHSVVEKMTFVRDVMSCLLFNVMLGWEVPLGFTILHAIFSGLLVLSYMFFLPYYSMWMNRFYVCVHTVECLISIFVACSLNHYNLRDGDATSAILLGGGVLVCALLVYGTDVRVNPSYGYEMLRAMECTRGRRGSVVSDELNEDDESETGSISQEDVTRRVDDAVVDALPYPKGLFQNCAFSQYAGLNVHVVESITQQEMSRLENGGMWKKKNNKTYPVLVPFVSRVYMDTDVSLAASSVDLYALQFEPEQLSDLMLVYGANMYSRALTTFADNAEVMLAFAAFITSYLPGLSFMGVDLLKRILRGSTTADQQFRSIRQANDLRVALGIRTHAHSIRSLKARTAHGRALQSIHKFWVKLTEPSVNIKEVSEVADMINERCDIAIAHFESALRNMQTADHVLMRRLGDFFSEVMMAPDAAHECYNEGRDIYEARQARSMRGTRQHTSVEIDIVSLSERMTEMLRYNRSGRSTKSTSTSSEIMKKFAVAVSLLFIAVLACTVMMIIGAVGVQNDAEVILHTILSAGTLSIIATGFGSLVAQYSLVVSDALASVWRTSIQTLMGMFLEHFRYITSGKGRPKSSECTSLLTTNNIPMYSSAAPGSGPLSLWGFSEMFLQGMQRFANSSEEDAATMAASLNQLFVINSAGALCDSFSTYLHLVVTNELPSVAHRWIIWTTIVFGVSLLLLLCVYISVNFALHKTAMNRVFAFQLFTLIPFDALEKLAMEAKERYHRIQVDKSFKENADRIDGKGEIANDVEHQYTSGSNKAYVGDSAGKVKSCLKGANDSAEGGADTRGRRVRFNPVVQVVGQVDDKKAEAARRTDDADEDDDALGMTLRDQQQKRQNLIGSTERTTVTESFLGLVASIVFMIVMSCCAVVCIATMAIVLSNHISKYSPSITAYMDFQNKIISAGLLPPQAVQRTLSYIRTGSIVHYQNSQNYISEMFEVIPQLVGEIVPLSSAPQLWRMHQIAQIVGNITLDASVVAAKFHGVSLEWSSNARALDALSESDVLAAMAVKYPAEYTAATNICNTYLNSANFTQQLAYVIVGSQIPAYSSEFRELYFTVVNEVGALAYSDISMESPELIVAIIAPGIASCLCAIVLAIGPIRRIVEISFHRYLIIAAMCSFMLVCILSIAILTQSHKIQEKYTSFDESVTVLNVFSDQFLTAVENYIGFVATTQSLMWYTAYSVDPLEAMNALSNAVIGQFLSVLDTDIFSSIIESGYTMRLLDNVAAALTINVMNATGVYVETAMMQDLQATYWNLAADPQQVQLEVQFPGTLFYNNTEADLAQSISEQYTAALNIISSPRYLDNVFNILQQVSLLYAMFVKGEYSNSLNALDDQSALVYVALGSCVFPLLVAVLCGVFMVLEIRRSLNLDEKSSHSLLNENRAYTVHLFRTQAALIILGMLYAAEFSVGIWLTQICDVYGNQLQLAMNTASDIAKLSYFFSLKVSPFITYVSENAILDMSTILLSNMNTQFQGYTRLGVPQGLQISDEYDGLMLGSTMMNDAMTLMLRFMSNNCSAPMDGKLPFPNVSTNLYSAGMTEPFIEATLTANQLVLPFIDPRVDFQTLAATASIDTIMQLAGSEVSIFFAGSANNQLLYNSITHAAKSPTSAVVALGAICMVATLLVFSGVIIPTILLLIREEEAIRMLLHLIPTHVAEEVPAIAQYLETGNTSNSSELQKKFEASEKLLQNILPEKIAARLKSGEQPIADTHDCVTMLFTDFVGFTKRSSTMQAREIVDFLNEVFLEFDTVVELLSLEKIKTIGDAFFMAAGLDAQMRDHALRVVEAGLMFFEALEEHNRRHPSRVPLQMRLGVHSGPVVAGVIGIKKVAYDLWGDSVEIANAMESTGVPGYVHISESTAELVRGFFKLEPRGELPREKEHIPDDMPNTYLVVGRLLPTPYMHLRRPKLLRNNLIETN